MNQYLGVPCIKHGSEAAMSNLPQIVEDLLRVYIEEQSRILRVLVNTLCLRHTNVPAPALLVIVPVPLLVVVVPVPLRDM